MSFCAWCGTEVRDARTNCAKCNRPISGAPASAPPVAIPQAPAPGQKSPILLAILILSIPVMLFVAAMLLVIAVPRLIKARNLEKQARTMTELRTIGTAVGAYQAEHSEYPQAADASALTTVLVPKYVAALPQTDGWQHPFKYQCWSKTGDAKCDSFSVGSGGSDGLFEHATLREYEDTTTTSRFDCDLIFTNGSFIESPEATQ